MNLNFTTIWRKKINNLIRKCKSCELYAECRDSIWSWVFLFIGIIAAFAMRLVAFFIYVNPYYAKTSWYAGVVFFIMFFIYRYNVSLKRSKKIKKEDLIVKVKANSLSSRERKSVSKLLCSLTSKKERINFAVIFVLSGITLIIAVILDLI